MQSNMEVPATIGFGSGDIINTESGSNETDLTTFIDSLSDKQRDTLTLHITHSAGTTTGYSAGTKILKRSGTGTEYDCFFSGGSAVHCVFLILTGATYILYGRKYNISSTPSVNQDLLSITAWSATYIK